MLLPIFLTARAAPTVSQGAERATDMYEEKKQAMHGIYPRSMQIVLLPEGRRR